ncbi:hypothetical protein [uncultured Desulfovibrio sp.]|uniref:hypothetical protein n=1 Tax=uncultured Desulfovibrio sp. TaxID=167968 RepID=UPI0026313B04|nr:hypothetical protein [uncultured Desulfovibrio sp.]
MKRPHCRLPLSRFPRASRKKNMNSVANEHNSIRSNERIAIYNSNTVFLRDSIKYMFYANAGAITGVLIKLDIQTYKFPIFIFAFGIAYTLIIPIFMFSHTKYIISKSFKNKRSPFDSKSYPYFDMAMRIIIMILVYVPILFFVYGLIATFDIILNIPILSPLESLKNYYK